MADLINYEQLAEASRTNDAIAEERGLGIACQEAGVDLEGLTEAAAQRALRMALMATGEVEKVKALARGNRLEILRLTPEQSRLAVQFQGLYMDGVTTGVRAQRKAGE